MANALIRKIRSLLPKRARRAAHRIGCFLGDPSEVTPSLEAALAYLSAWGFRPTFAVDVGAYHGEWTHLFKAVFPSSRVLMIEGQSEKAAILQEACRRYPGDVTAEIALLGPNDGQRVRFVEMGTGSSVLEETSPYPRRYVDKTLVTLDSLLKRHFDFGKVDFLKVDVQGYELEVLRGSTDTLKRADFVLMETSLIPVNRGCPLVSDVVGFMAARAYRLLDFCSQVRRRDGALWQTDLLFIRETSAFLPEPSLNPANWV